MALCRRCGLCCDGTLFAWVTVGPAELPALQGHGLPVMQRADGSHALRQPCAALCGKDCTVYEDRPLPCRQFRCQQLIALEEGEIDLPEALRVVERAQWAIAEVAAAVSPAAAEAEPSAKPSSAAVEAAWPVNSSAAVEAAQPLTPIASVKGAKPLEPVAAVEAARTINPIAALRAQVAAGRAPPDRAEALRRIEALLARGFLGRARRA